MVELDLCQREFQKHLSKGLQLFTEGDLTYAQEAFEKADFYLPEQPQVLNYLGQLYYQNGEWQKAGQIYHKLIEKYPHSAILQSNLGWVLLKAGNFEAAAQVFENLLVKFTEHQQGCLGMGMVQWQLRNYELAQVHFKKAGAEKFWNRLVEQVDIESSAKVTEVSSEDLSEPESDFVFYILEGRALRAKVQGELYVQTGSISACLGDLSYNRRYPIASGVESAGRKEGFICIEGQGSVILSGKYPRMSIRSLENETLLVQSSRLVAFQPQLIWESKRLGSAGGSFGIQAISLTGNGLIAISHSGAMTTLAVKPEQPVFTSSTTLVAWSDTITPNITRELDGDLFTGSSDPNIGQIKLDGYGSVLMDL